MRKNIINYIVLILITGIVLYFSLKDNFVEIINNVLNFNFGWLLLAIILFFVYLFCKTISLSILVNKTNNKISLMRLFKIMIIVEFFQGVTPFGSGGQASQAVLLKKEGMRVSTATNVVTQQFLVYQVALIICGIVAIIINKLLNVFPTISMMGKIVFLGFVIDLVIVFFLLIISFGKKINYKLVKIVVKLLCKLKIIKDEIKFLNKTDDFLEKFYLGGLAFKNNKFVLLKAVVYNFLALLIIYIIPIIIFYGFGNYKISLINVIIGSSFIRFIGAFIPTPGAIGGIEFGYINFFGNYITGHILLSSMLLWRFVTYYLILIIGGIMIVFYKKKGD